MKTTKYLQGRLKEYLYASSKLTADFIIAKTILDNLENFPDVYLKQIAIEAQVAESTVTKFCNKLGYDGFRELRNDVIDEPLEQDFEILLEQIKQTNDVNTIIQTILKEENHIMQQALANFDMDALENIAELIQKNKQGIILSPVYLSESITVFEEFLKKKAYDFYYIARSSDRAIIEECLRENSMIMIFSIKGEWVQNNQKLINFLKENNHQIVLFTCNTSQNYPQIDIVFNIGDEEIVAKQSAFIQYIYFKSLILMIAAKC